MPLIAKGDFAASLSSPAKAIAIIVWHNAMSGKVERRSFRRPNESMAQRAGMAMVQLMIPNPREVESALTGLTGTARRIVVE